MKLDEYLWRNKISISELARRVGMARMHISRVVHHEEMPSIYCAIKISKAIDKAIPWYDVMKEAYETIHGPIDEPKTIDQNTLQA